MGRRECQVLAPLSGEGQERRGRWDGVGGAGGKGEREGRVRWEWEGEK